ncbi:hypothetical protein CYMTET_49225 [Cymbomonas tetramitiformis]|uniref:Uncharacterized protein n=1 Tax=Cymbomonas tetramitiformis TaxID=36881 RepID=A0AAE0BSL9_9CHLO|nr:hypothetical protein CYMTET_49225 [Cymbomonas tetramitiformis]
MNYVQLLWCWTAKPRFSASARTSTVTKETSSSILSAQAIFTPKTSILHLHFAPLVSSFFSVPSCVFGSSKVGAIGRMASGLPKRKAKRDRHLAVAEVDCKDYSVAAERFDFTCLNNSYEPFNSHQEGKNDAYPATIEAARACKNLNDGTGVMLEHYERIFDRDEFFCGESAQYFNTYRENVSWQVRYAQLNPDGPCGCYMGPGQLVEDTSTLTVYGVDSESECQLHCERLLSYDPLAVQHGRTQSCIGFSHSYSSSQCILHTNATSTTLANFDLGLKCLPSAAVFGKDGTCFLIENATVAAEPLRGHGLDGDLCATAVDCRFPSMSCSKSSASVWTLDQTLRCIGLAVGEACEVSEMCAFDLACVAGTCQQADVSSCNFDQDCGGDAMYGCGKAGGDLALGADPWAPNKCYTQFSMPDGSYVNRIDLCESLEAADVSAAFCSLHTDSSGEDSEDSEEEARWLFLLERGQQVVADSGEYPGYPLNRAIDQIISDSTASTELSGLDATNSEEDPPYMIVYLGARYEIGKVAICIQDRGMSVGTAKVEASMRQGGPWSLLFDTFLVVRQNGCTEVASPLVAMEAEFLRFTFPTTHDYEPPDPSQGLDRAKFLRRSPHTTTPLWGTGSMSSTT